MAGQRALIDGEAPRRLAQVSMGRPAMLTESGVECPSCEYVPPVLQAVLQSVRVQAGQLGMGSIEAGLEPRTSPCQLLVRASAMPPVRVRTTR